MRYILLLSSLLFLVSCHKEAGKPNFSPDDGLIGRWNLVVDSSYNGIGINSELNIYSGRPGDYYAFDANGLLYIHEGGAQVNFGYTLDSGSLVHIDTLGTFFYRLGSNTATLFIPTIISPGGVIGRSIHLSR